MNFMNRIQSRIELGRIEDKYVSRKNRNVWKSEAQYVNGEYIYACREEVEPPPSRTSNTAKPSSSSGTYSSQSSSRTTSSRDSDQSASSTTSKWSLSSAFGSKSKGANVRMGGSSRR
ncbi:hypothetical protein EJ08DRAFT_674780 [Tothia fuscella]|uniref:Uncharacterized protein n=1 Tax=Tothia fuscella TaxID=1048955 RepID=A0A9P4U3R3_9PEZI|nr:hypothetical protein EJ08DRAFT_674780 [Tothia fuscella]